MPIWHGPHDASHREASPRGSDPAWSARFRQGTHLAGTTSSREPTWSGPLPAGLGYCYRDITIAGGGPVRTKNMVLRLDPALAEQLEAVAEVERRSVSDVVREAITALVEARRGDERFIRLLEDNLARHRRILDMMRDEQL